jgi:8-oxo-dGTP pyrophosphatase MutT (NUDIX family)
MKRGPYEVISSQDVYKNPWIRVHEDKIIRPDGKEGMYGVIEYGAGVATVALNDKKEIFLVKEYAYAIDQYSISVPSGGIDGDEKPIEAAKREMREEAGVVAENWIDLGYIDPFTMIVNSPAYLFLALDAKLEARGEEEFELITVPFEEAVEMVMTSKITHGGSCVAILKTAEYLRKNKLLINL